MVEKSIFERIIDREVSARIVYEDELCIAFHDLEPQAPLHVLICPKRRINMVSSASA
jgi:histidine triad (HIT) family protein